MIIFDGIKKEHKVSLLVFSNEAGQRIEIPIETPIADRISAYLAKISHPVVKENKNIEDEE
jgi:hypothetical protein